MPKRRRAYRKTLESYTINRINQTIRVGDCVMLLPPNPREPNWVARVLKITSDNAERWVRVHIQWFYRPEDTIQGRRIFQGVKELLLSDHYDVLSINTIIGRCTVHTIKDYKRLENALDEDFFSRYEYCCTTGKILPEESKVYCVCLLPFNPDLLMVCCEGCGEKFHPFCIDMTNDEAKQMPHFYCRSCLVSERRILHS